MKTIHKPVPGEYAPYTIAYMDTVPNDGLLLNHLKDSESVISDYLRSLPQEKLTTPHAPGEWTVQEVLAHMIDTERIFAYRALRIARKDYTDLPGFEQDDYVPYSGANNRNLDDMLEEFSAVRAATLTLLNSFDDAAWERVGSASKHALSVRAAGYIIAGHALYHLNSMKENYG
jgi:hypothetical protein